MAATPRNSVSLNTDGYIEIKIIGDQDYLSFDALRKEAEELAIQLRYSQRAVRGLIDLTEMTGFNTGSNKAALEILGQIDYQKVALFGANASISTVTNLLIQALGKDDRTKLFPDRTSAVNWLMASPND